MHGCLAIQFLIHVFMFMKDLYLGMKIESPMIIAGGYGVIGVLIG